MHHGTEEEHTYTIHCWSSMDAILDLIQDPDLHPSFTFYPKHHYILNSQTNTYMRVWTDIHTGDDWWELQGWLRSLIIFIWLLISIRMRLDWKRLWFKWHYTAVLQSWTSLEYRKHGECGDGYETFLDISGWVETVRVGQFTWVSCQM